MAYIAILLIVAAFIGGWWYTVRTLKDMGPLMPHLLGIPVGFVAMFCVAAICFFFGIISI